MIKSYDKYDIVHIGGVDHPESISVGRKGEAYTTGTGCQVYRVDLETNITEQFATTENRCLGQAVDADGNLYCADCVAGKVLKITPAGQISTYATGPGGQLFVDNAGVPLGPEGLGRLEAAAYCSLTEVGKDRILWYPDRKGFLVGKLVTDEWLADMDVPE